MYCTVYTGSSLVALGLDLVVRWKWVIDKVILDEFLSLAQASGYVLANDLNVGACIGEMFD